MNTEKIKQQGKRMYAFEDASTLRFNSKKENQYLGSQAYFPFYWKGWLFGSSENLYQFLAFVNIPDIQTEMLATDKSYLAKFWGNYHHEDKNPLFWKYRLDVFRYSLIIKAEGNANFKKRLLSTKDKNLVEYCYWNTDDKDNIFAAKKEEDNLVGYNVHGRLLMQIRRELNNGTFNEWSKMIKDKFEEDYLSKTNTQFIINSINNESRK